MTPEERARHFVVGSAHAALNGDEKIRSLAHEFRLVAAETREACAKIAEATNDCCDCIGDEFLSSPYHEGSNAAAAIRAQGKPDGSAR